jgi:hypothetical protein
MLLAAVCSSWRSLVDDEKKPWHDSLTARGSDGPPLLGRFGRRYFVQSTKWYFDVSELLGIFIKHSGYDYVKPEASRKIRRVPSGVMAIACLVSRSAC